MPQLPPSPACSRAGFLRGGSSLAVFFAAALLTIAAGAAICYFLPRQYYSHVIMEIEKDDHSLHIYWDGKPEDPNLWKTQAFRTIRSKEVLYPVIDSLKLAETWSARAGGRVLPKEKVYARLLGMLQLQTIRSTDLVEIGIYSTDRVEAADIANAIAAAFQKMRRDEEIQKRDSALSQLREEVAIQRKRVEDLRAELARIRQREGISDPNPEAIDPQETAKPNSDAATRPNQDYISVKSEYIKARRVLEQAEQRLTTQNVQLKMTMNPAKIWEQAEPSQYPAKPRVLVIMSLAVFASPFVGLLAAGLFGLCTRRNQPLPPPPLPGG